MKALILLLVCGAVSMAGEDSTELPEFLLDLPHCKIPQGPLFPDEVLRAWNTPFKTSCPKLQTIGIVFSDKILRLDPSVEGKYERCCYREILRPEILESDKYLLTPCKELGLIGSLDISEMEFLLLNCTKVNETGHVLDFHYNIRRDKPEIQKKLDYWSKKAEQPLNIMFVIIDSVSRTHALRSLPKTLKVLRDELGFTDFKGYHCVGEPSSTNYIPMTLGILWEDLELRRSSMKGKWDSEPFIYKNFSQSNYLTMQMEDMASYNVFNFNGRTGFTIKPFDFYLRPYMLIHEKLGPRFNNFSSLTCINGKNIFDFLLDYTLEFLETFPRVPKYTTTYLTWPNHDWFPGTRVMDKSFRAFFRALAQRGVLNSTVVVVVADHGFRFAADYAESKYGLLERDLPLFMIKLPPAFEKRYPGSNLHLARNAKVVTSHLDLFKTVVHLHGLMTGGRADVGNYGYNMKYGRSLIQEIPTNRTCAQAMVPERFCACNFPLQADAAFEYERYRKPLTGK